LDELHIHYVTHNTPGLQALKAAEIANGRPLNRQDINKILPDFHWMHEPGIHLGFLTGTLDLVFAVEIQ
jgi:hypothetical protein